MPTPADIVRYLSEEREKKEIADLKRQEAEREKARKDLERIQAEAREKARKQAVMNVINPILCEVKNDFRNTEEALNIYRHKILAEFEACIILYYDKKIALPPN